MVIGIAAVIDDCCMHWGWAVSSSRALMVAVAEIGVSLG